MIEMETKQKSSKLRGTLILLSLVGLINAAYLTYLYFMQASDAEGITNIHRSEYARIGPIPIAILGCVFYLACLLLSKAYKPPMNPPDSFPLPLGVLSVLSTIGAIFSLRMMYINFFIVENACPFCTASAVFAILIYIITSLTILKNHCGFDLFIGTMVGLLLSVIMLIVLQLPPRILAEGTLTEGQFSGYNYSLARVSSCGCGSDLKLTLENKTETRVYLDYNKNRILSGSDYLLVTNSEGGRVFYYGAKVTITKPETWEDKDALFARGIQEANAEYEEVLGLIYP